MNDSLTWKFLDLREGAKVVVLKPFWPLNRPLTERTVSVANGLPWNVLLQPRSHPSVHSRRTVLKLSSPPASKEWNISRIVFLGLKNQVRTFHLSHHQRQTAD